MTKQEPPRNEKVYARSTNSHPAGPTPPPAPASEIWDLIDRLMSDEPEAAPKKAVPDPKRRRGEARRRQRRTRWRRALDLAGTVVWLFVGVKLFIGDLDRVLLAVVAPQAIGVLDFRWLLVLVLIALLMLLFNWRRLGLSTAYVAGFPLVILLWKIPKFLVKRRSPLFIVGIAGIVVSISSRARPFTIALAIACVSGAMISSSEMPWAAVGVGAMAVALLWWLTITAIDLLRSTAFIRSQKKLIDGIFKSKLIERISTFALPNRVTIKSWSVDDAKKFRDGAGYAVLATRALQFWAACLDQYRRGPSVVILSIIAVVGLTAQVMLAFTFINFGVYIASPSGFSATAPPNWWTFAYYTAAGTYFGEISALAPVGALAIAAKLANGVLGLIVIGTVIISICLNYRSVRAETDAVGAARSLNEKADEIADISSRQLEMTFEEIEARLRATSWGLLGITRWLATYADKTKAEHVEGR
ncbi:hypothetical protein [Curtobacterium sp. RIT-PI-V]|uniref:hypothetical protein n=1 Tax=Curtobacterium sp. RIT-PI-V TaxID=3035296 RepID=UPI0021D79BA7|nr:hypothetical protein [Curtobacterium sp. RIT-PI-V]